MNLEAIAPVLEQIIKESLEEKRYPFGFSNYKGVGNKVASGRLRDSVTVEVKQSSQGIDVISVMMEEYYQWVQSGRAPGKKFVPIGALISWIKSRRLKGRNKKGRYITDKSFAFAIRKNINKFGIRPSNFLDISLNKIENDDRIVELIGDASYEELINLIEGI
jgi:hypothetical protein